MARPFNAQRTAVVSPVAPKEELVLAGRVRAGDAAAFETLFRALIGPMTRFVMRTVGSRDVAQDIVQDVFVRLWTDRARLAVRDSLRAYLYSAAHRQALNAVRHHRTETRLHGDFALLGRSPATGTLSGDAAERAERGEVVSAVDRAMDSVPPRAREVALLRWVEGLERAEIATALGLSIKTVDAHLQVASRIVRARLQGVWP